VLTRIFIAEFTVNIHKIWTCITVELRSILVERSKFRSSLLWSTDWSGQYTTLTRSQLCRCLSVAIWIGCPIKVWRHAVYCSIAFWTWQPVQRTDPDTTDVSYREVNCSFFFKLYGKFKNETCIYIFLFSLIINFSVLQVVIPKTLRIGSMCVVRYLWRGII
jgi:hypothetical protein